MKAKTSLDVPKIYQIKVRGILDDEWSDGFDGFKIRPQSDNVTILEGPISDQGALHGILAKIRDLGLTILSLHAEGF